MNSEDASEREHHDQSECSTALRAITVRYEDEPDECTIFPHQARQSELVTTWITAQEGSYVALAEVR